VAQITVAEALTRSDDLQQSDSPLLDAQLILADVLGRERSWLIAHNDEFLDSATTEDYLARLARRARGEPVAYLLGRRSFWTFEVKVTPDVLDPRPDTELLVEASLETLTKTHQVVLDAGTGSGIIALALALERPDWLVIASDRYREPLAVAAQNFSQVGNILPVQADWCQSLADSSLDAVISNPPYLRDDDPHLTNLQYEPRRALTAGTDGLDHIEAIIDQSLRALKPGGYLLLEHGYDQQTSITSRLSQRKFQIINLCTDLAGQPRVIIARTPDRDTPDQDRHETNSATQALREDLNG
jgi:release factor glutamine methyltransferase